MKKSFTLIEILVVVFIIAMMSTVAVVVFERGNYTMRQNDNIRRHDLNQLAAALEEFKADHGHYPLINWNNGIHAYSQLGYTSSACNGTQSSYLASLRADSAFRPGTQLKNVSSVWCDDLSLQLMGRIYLTKMPMPIDNNPLNDDTEVATMNYWSTDPTLVKKYVDDIPMDPNYDQIVTSSNTDYTPGAGNRFRYSYNSFYECVVEGISVGDRYWLDAVMQLSRDNISDSVTGLYFNEIGNINLYRAPKNTCS